MQNSSMLVPHIAGCRIGVTLFSPAELLRDDHLLRVGGGELVARATSGQYFRISPVSRP